jgi:hypothetical protein
MRSTGFGATGRGVLGLASRDKQFAKQLHKDLLALGVSIDDKTGNGHNKWLLSYKDKAEMLIFSKSGSATSLRETIGNLKRILVEFGFDRKGLRFRVARYSSNDAMLKGVAHQDALRSIWSMIDEYEGDMKE